MSFQSKGCTGVPRSGPHARDVGQAFVNGKLDVLHPRLDRHSKVDAGSTGSNAYDLDVPLCCRSGGTPPGHTEFPSIAQAGKDWAHCHMAALVWCTRRRFAASTRSRHRRDEQMRVRAHPLTMSVVRRPFHSFLEDDQMQLFRSNRCSQSVCDEGHVSALAFPPLAAYTRYDPP